MEPVTLILSALAAGAVKAAGDTVPDVYKALKELIKRKFASKPQAEMVLEEHEKDPQTYEVPLKKKLVEADVDKDEEILKKAQELLKLANPQETAQGKYNIKAEQIKGIVGDISGGNVNQTIS